MLNQKTTRSHLEAAGQLTGDVVAACVDGHIVDLHTFVEEKAGCTPILASDPRGLEVIRHSTAHVMADAVQRLFPGTKVTFGPAIEEGFYYDFDKPGAPFTEEDLRTIEEVMLRIVQKNSHFRREIVSRSEAIQLFESMGEAYKVEHIRTIPEHREITLYRHGGVGGDREWVDLCAGPHVPSTGFLKAVKLTSVAGAYWRGDERNPMLQRIYGTAFSSQVELDEHLHRLEEAKKRDHRKLGKELELFVFDPVAPAMPFFLPKGAFVYNTFVAYLRTLYERYGYEEVITPQVFDPSLFRTSGHLSHYSDNMYRLWTADLVEAKPQKGATSTEVISETVASASALGRTSEEYKCILSEDNRRDEERSRFMKSLQANAFALKPMNCPAHCVLFGSRTRSYRELPWRVADFGRLHRYERGGVVHGLSRVRSFCQDDAHIFCTEAQIVDEIERFIKSLYEVYEALQLTQIDIKLATRPESRLGLDEEWDRSEAALAEGLRKAGLPFSIAPGEGAFYGPKIEFHVRDALKRSWQLGTLQYDANMPERFDLKYAGEDGKVHKPVMLHRAILGSLERFFGVFLEHCGGNFPVWLAPRQAIVLTVSEHSDTYAKHVWSMLQSKGLRVDTDLSADKLGAKIRNARIGRYPYLCVVGRKEEETGTVGVRSRERGELGSLPLEEFAALLVRESAPPGRTNDTSEDAAFRKVMK